jgi:two-component system copper resistance phosphate regulon response regulator CusR
MLTARDKVEDRVRGLEQGADDYLVKPFAFSELLARVTRCCAAAPPAVRRRPPSCVWATWSWTSCPQGRAGAAAAGPDGQGVQAAGLLLRRRGQILSRTTLAEQVWDMNFDSDTNVVEVAVRRLRAKLDDPFPAKLLHTVRGMGYVLEERA